MKLMIKLENKPYNERIKGRLEGDLLKSDLKDKTFSPANVLQSPMLGSGK